MENPLLVSTARNASAHQKSTLSNVGSFPRGQLDLHAAGDVRRAVVTLELSLTGFFRRSGTVREDADWNSKEQ